MIQGLPQKLKDLRTKHGYSQKQVAEKIGVSPSIVSGYETGERTPSTEVLLSLSYLYNCSCDYLLGKKPEQPAPTLNLHGLTNQQINALIALVGAIRNGNK